MSLDLGDFPSDSRTKVSIFYGNSKVAAETWQSWTRPRGCTMAYILACAGGAGGGSGAAGAASTAAGGGGGGGSGLATLTIPLLLLPDTLFLSVGAGGAAQNPGILTRVSISPDNPAVADNCLLTVSAPTQGGNAAGATAGAAGAAGVVPTVTNGPLSQLGQSQFRAGIAGIIGGTTVPGAALSVVGAPLLTGGTGGGGLPAANTAGSAGGAITGSGLIQGLAGGVGGTTAPTAGSDGQAGGRLMGKLFYFLGGTGGGSSGLTVTPTGSNGGNGGNGGYGCGGGGGGGAFTASTAGVGGRGGPGLVVIIAW